MSFLVRGETEKSWHNSRGDSCHSEAPLAIAATSLDVILTSATWAPPLNHDFRAPHTLGAPESVCFSPHLRRPWVWGELSCNSYIDRWRQRGGISTDAALGEILPERNGIFAGTKNKKNVLYCIIDVCILILPINRINKS